MFKEIFSDAIAHVKGTKEYPNINGTVSFKKTKDGVLLTAKIKGLPQAQNKNCFR